MPRKRAQVVTSPDTTEDEALTQNDPPTDVDDNVRDFSIPTKGPSRSKPKAKRRPSAVFGDASNGDISRPSFTDLDSVSRSKISQMSSFTEVDDRAEKRMRRKSARVSFVAPSDNEGDATQEASTSATGQNSEQDSGHPERRHSMRTARLSGGAPSRINAVAPAPAPVVSMDVMNSNFEEWMKMATDNKINAANSWNFALIDYFHEMSLLRNTDDNSINFQKASFTLDGCVKIWTSRVDSVGTETGKLLSNLAQDNNDAQDEPEEGNPDAEGEDGEKTKKRKVHRTEATLVKAYGQLQVKKLDLDFAVDPLFRKTRAEFDEGGAMGLLLNHLGVDSRMRVVFDSGDSKILDDDEEEFDVHQTIELTDIRTNFIPSLETLETRSIAQELGDFRFSSDPKDLDFTFANKTRDEDSGELPSFSNSSPFDDDDEGGGGLGDFGGGHDAQDFFTGDQAVGDDAMPAPGGFGFGGDDEDGDGAGTNHGPGSGVGIGGVEPFDPRRPPNERDLVMAMNDDDDEMLDYFDANFMKNWAGPEHWKLRRVIKKPGVASSEPPRARREKSAFQITFMEPAERTAKQIMTPAAKSSMIALPAKTGASTSSAVQKSKGRLAKTKKPAVKRDDHLLPDDMHFTSQQLLRLFLKPKFTLKMRRYGVAAGQLNEQGDGEVDQHFWAQANQGAGDEYDQTQGGGPIPFNTQFFHDDFDDDDGPGFDDEIIEPGEIAIPSALDEEGDLLAATQGQLKRVRPEFVNYARKAKRVDVRKLKDNIWKGLKIITPKETTDEDEDVPVEKQLTDPEQPRKFESVIQGLRTAYTPDKMEEISTSFCFICLLHLANERGLKIEVADKGALHDDDDDDGRGAETQDRTVGDIWSLNVYRDPTATAAA